MRDEIDPESWTLQYPLGLVARSLLAGDSIDARTRALRILDRIGDNEPKAIHVHEEYRAEEFRLGLSIRLADKRLIPLWVADRNLRLGEVYRPTTMPRKFIAACALRVFLESIDE
jgi:hypothetical protein